MDEKQYEISHDFTTLHKDVFNGSTITPEVRAQWLRDTGWKEEDVQHYDNAGIEYSIAARNNELTDVFNLFGRDYIWIEGFVFEDYKYARSTINIRGNGNVVINKTTSPGTKVPGLV